MLLLCDNSREHKSVHTIYLIEKFAWTVFLPLSCILDITPHFDLFCRMKGCEGTVNAGDQTLQDIRFLWQHRKENSCRHVGMHDLVQRWKRNFNKDGDYIEK